MLQSHADDLTNYLDAKTSNLGVMSIDLCHVYEEKESRFAGNNEKLVTELGRKLARKEI